MAFTVQQGAAQPDVSSLARSLGHSAQSWQAAGHVYEPYTGIFKINQL
jgi:hypothetical protein